MNEPGVPLPLAWDDDPSYPDLVIADIAREAHDTLTLSHVVHVTDPYLDIPIVFGPFPTPLDAAAFVERYRADLSYEGCDQPLTATVIPLRPY